MFWISFCDLDLNDSLKYICKHIWCLKPFRYCKKSEKVRGNPFFVKTKQSCHDMVTLVFESKINAPPLLYKKYFSDTIFNFLYTRNVFFLVLPVFCVLLWIVYNQLFLNALFLLGHLQEQCILTKRRSRKL